jgi:ABC-type multidrug transport system fused ATPase/permease subunit
MNTGMGFEFSTIIQLISSTIAIIVIGFFISWKLTLIMLCLIPLVVVSAQLFSKVFCLNLFFDLMFINLYFQAHSQRGN